MKKTNKNANSDGYISKNNNIGRISFIYQYLINNRLLILLSLLVFNNFALADLVSSDKNQICSQQLNSRLDKEEITPEEWRSIHLEISKPDDSISKIDLLRPLWWLNRSKAKIGKEIYISIPEMGIEGQALVKSIKPCKVDSRKSKPGLRVVTGKFEHDNAIVLDLYFNNNPDEHIGVTSNHPIWSLTRNNWVKANDLKIGESLQTKDYRDVKLTMRSERPGRYKVYNLEVHKSHNYYVSNLGLLVHNSSNPDCDELLTFYHGTSREGAHSIKDKIKLSKSRTTDFGQVFYTTSKAADAQRWALQFDDPVVLEIKIKRSDYERLSIKNFPKADDEWREFVTKNRLDLGYEFPQYDLISGPVVANPSKIKSLWSMDSVRAIKGEVDQQGWATTDALRSLKVTGEVEFEW